MSYNTRLQTANTDLQGLIDKANALPDAGSSSGSTVTGYCEVAVTSDYTSECHVCYIGVNGWTSDSINHSPYTVQCGSQMTMFQYGYYGATVSAGEILSWVGSCGCVYQVPNEPNTSVTIDIVTD